MVKTDSQADAEKVYHLLPHRGETTASPVLLLLCGLPGTGKSFLARKIAEQTPCAVVESDFVRKALAGDSPTYAADESAYIHRVSHAVVERLLLEGHRVIHDATNLAEWHREQLYRVARRTRSKLVIVQTIAPDPVVRKRLAQRFVQRDPRDLSDADWSVHELLKPELEGVRRPHLVIDTTGDMDKAVRAILHATR